MKTIESSRLVMRGFQLEDASDVFDYAKREDVGPKAGWKPHSNQRESHEIIERFIEKDDVYAIVFKENQKVIGSLGIHFTTLGTFGEVFELGYVLHPDYHRKGIMYEAIMLALDWFFLHENHQQIYVGHFIENIASQQLIHKLGFEWVEDILYHSRDYGEKKSKIYQLSQNQYRLLRRNG